MAVVEGYVQAESHTPSGCPPVRIVFSTFDFRGIGKEYAVDRCARLIVEQEPVVVLINFGGDLYVSGSRRNGQPLAVGSRTNVDRSAGWYHRHTVAAWLYSDNGDAHRYLVKDGIRYSHIFDPLRQAGPRCATLGDRRRRCLHRGRYAGDIRDVTGK